MSETPEVVREHEHEHETTTPMAAQSAEQWRREGFRGHGRIFRLAALVTVIAGIVFIVAVIFWSGFVLGASNGHHHHGEHGGGGHSSQMMQDDGPGR